MLLLLDVKVILCFSCRKIVYVSTCLVEALIRDCGSALLHV